MQLERGKWNMRKTKKRGGNVHSETDRLEIAGITWDFAPFGLVFMAKKFLDAAKTVVAQEAQLPAQQWHPVGKYLACHSIELSLKAFLALKGERLAGVKGFGHDLSDLLQKANKQKFDELVVLSAEERSEILKASPYYNQKVFEYPSLPEAVQAYPGDPMVPYLLSAAEKLVDTLYELCQAAA